LLLPWWVVIGQQPKVMNDPTHDDRPIHFGFSIGINFMDYAVKHSDFAEQNNYHIGLPNLQPGINIHAVSNLRLARYFDLRFLPGISFGERYIEIVDSDNNIIYEEGDLYKSESSYLEFPVLIKYKAKRLNNFRSYLVSGVNVKYDLAVKKKYDERDQLFMVEPVNINYEIGMGFDFYMAYFKLSTEIKYSVGLRNIFSPTAPNGDPPDDYPEVTSSIDKLFANMLVISFHFE
jgi:hypothetical protein